MRACARCFRRCCLLLLVWTASGMASGSDAVVERLHNGDVLLLRHALAPGFGDPAGFELDDCATQRNLSAAGRRQAAAIGAWLRARGIGRAEVYASQWCRCLDTAALLGLGEVVPLSALNSFFQRPSEKAGRLAALRDFLADRTARDLPLVLVTHQVTITALSGIFPGSGEGVVATLGEGGELRRFARIGFDQ